MQGNPAKYGELDPDFGPYPRAVLWHGSADHWYRVSCDLDRNGILRIAATVRAGSYPMAVPFRLTALPAGVTMVQLIEARDHGKRAMIAGFELGAPDQRLSMEISSTVAPWYAEGPVESREFNGLIGEIRTATQTICLITQSDPICVSGPRDEPASDWSAPARRTAILTAEALIPVADPADESTWIDADQAFPR